MYRRFFKIAALSFLALGFGRTERNPYCYALPESNFKVSKGEKFQSTLTESEVNTVIEQFLNLYEEELALLDKKMFLSVDWSDDRVNAYATRDDDNNLVIKLFGGMVRYPTMDIETLNLVICHEIGHYLGGAPKKLRGNSGKKDWSSVEGQADFYATAICLKRFYHYTAQSLDSVSMILKGSLNFARLNFELRPVGPNVSLERRDSFVTPETFSAYPSYQCRLDTYQVGATCSDDFTQEFDMNNPSIGPCAKLRPVCWFRP